MSNSPAAALEKRSKALTANTRMLFVAEIGIVCTPTARGSKNSTPCRFPIKPQA